MLERVQLLGVCLEVEYLVAPVGIRVADGVDDLVTVELDGDLLVAEALDLGAQLLESCVSGG